MVKKSLFRSPIGAFVRKKLENKYRKKTTKKER
jgi:hypothetical protein